MSNEASSSNGSSAHPGKIKLDLSEDDDDDTPAKVFWISAKGMDEFQSLTDAMDPQNFDSDPESGVLMIRDHHGYGAIREIEKDMKKIRKALAKSSVDAFEMLEGYVVAIKQVSTLGGGRGGKCAAVVVLFHFRSIIPQRLSITQKWL